MLNGYLATFYCTEFYKSDAACSEDYAAFSARDTVPAPSSSGLSPLSP